MAQSLLEEIAFLSLFKIQMTELGQILIINCLFVKTALYTCRFSKKNKLTFYLKCFK